MCNLEHTLRLDVIRMLHFLYSLIKDVFALVVCTLANFAVLYFRTTVD